MVTIGECVDICDDRGVMVSVVGNGTGDTSSKPGLGCLYFPLRYLGKDWTQLFSLYQWVNSRAGCAN